MSRCISPLPGLSPDDYKELSPETSRYNALAWAIGGEAEDCRWWSPEPFSQYYWPQGLSKDETLETFIELFSLHGYVLCQGNELNLEPEFEKVAIYCKYGKPTHVARQQGDGWWTSKLGKGHDLKHKTASCLEGEVYGSICCVLKRKINQLNN